MTVSRAAARRRVARARQHTVRVCEAAVVLSRAIDRSTLAATYLGAGIHRLAKAAQETGNSFALLAAVFGMAPIRDL